MPASTVCRAPRHLEKAPLTSKTVPPLVTLAVRRAKLLHNIALLRPLTLPAPLHLDHQTHSMPHLSFLLLVPSILLQATPNPQANNNLLKHHLLPNPLQVPSRRSAKLHRLKHTHRLQWQDPHKWPRLILSLPTNTRLLQHRTPRHKLQAILQVTRKPLPSLPPQPRPGLMHLRLALSPPHFPTPSNLQDRRLSHPIATQHFLEHQPSIQAVDLLQVILTVGDFLDLEHLRLTVILVSKALLEAKAILSSSAVILVT